MSIGWVSASPVARTGYGRETKEVGYRIVDCGRDVVFIGTFGDVIIWGGVTEQYTPKGKKITILSLTSPSSAAAVINEYVDKYDLKMIVGFMDCFGLDYLNDVKVPVIGYIPIDGSFTQEMSHFMRNYHKIVAYSKFGYEELKKHYPPSQIGLIDHAVDVDTFKPLTTKEYDDVREWFLKEHGVPKDAFLAVDMGANVGPRKLLPLEMATFSKFAKKHPDAHLYLQTNAYGPPRGYNLISHRSVLGMENNIHFAKLDPIVFPAEDEELRRIFGGAQVFLHNAVAEGCGLPQREAMACGTPPIAPRNCYIEDTEVLAPTGIKKYSEFEEGDLVWSLNLDTNKLEAKPILKKFEEDYEGDIIHYTGAKYDLGVTPEHTMITAPRHHKASWTFEKALETMSKGRAPYPGGHSQFWIPLVASFDGKLENRIRISEFFDQKTLRYDCNRLPEEIELGDLLELCGWYIGDGSVSYDHRCKTSMVTSIWEPKNGKHRKELETLLEQLNIKHCKLEDKVTFQYYAFKPLWDQIGHKANVKRIPCWMLAFHVSLLKRLFKGIMNADGSNPEVSNSDCLRTASKNLRDTFMELCMKLGYSASYRPYESSMHIIEEGRTIKSSRGFDINVSTVKVCGSVRSRNKKMEHYQGKIWCFEVENNHNLLVGRNGKFCFSGNSAQTEQTEGLGWVVENIDLEDYVEYPVYVPTLQTYPVPSQKSMLEKLEEAYQNPDMVEAYGRRSRRFIVKNYSYKRIIPKWLSLLSEVDHDIEVLQTMRDSFQA
jgi:glycosyltransferase involved in cell wall biosynthesis